MQARAQAKRLIFTPAEKRRIIELYQSGLTLTEVGKEYSCCTTLIVRVLISLGIKRRKQGRFVVPPEDGPTVARRYVNGETLAQIGVSYGISKQGVQEILKGLGVPRRSSGWPRGPRGPRKQSSIKKLDIEKALG